MIPAVGEVIGVVMCCSIVLLLNDSEPMMLSNCSLSDSCSTIKKHNWLGDKLCVCSDKVPLLTNEMQISIFALLKN